MLRHLAYISHKKAHKITVRFIATMVHFIKNRFADMKAANTSLAYFFSGLRYLLANSCF